ncbi:amino acid ABC transporter substrate-binding protein [Phreatobacter oligotrophus]|jgi:general L-amino acid transport system substrate-binding protein|uniref:General L-amino acid transport system substrate-binding protein n=1 Tax=Phreatobacter oligotrophus TaxID=1122261 RepID=A0A2T4YXF2_9HYPH|nr:amino acid ABC transporter substrate-binding protein [Phreatobacter oligotrophus]MBX9991981.1 amino acid ABC transporter substrate-binding protein [Phreatobacter oligotrophus]PTM50851.1 general L-amino acid transport system substrate-binding protein [Phreatobacter oligotrophus]
MTHLARGALGAALLAFGAGAAGAQQLAPSPTLDAIRARGHVECGVHLGLPGFSFANDKGEWTGLDVDFCRAVAAAVLGDANKVRYTPTSVQQRWPVLQSGQVDLLSRNTTITFSRNVTLGVNFQGINFYEGQTFIVRTASGAKKPADLENASICVAAGSTEERTAADFFRERNIKVTIINFQKNDDAIAAYDAGRCDSYTAGIGALAGQRIKLKTPGEHFIMTETISNDPQGPVTRWGDERWQAVVRWVLNGMIAAEYLGVTSKNVDDMRANSKSAEIRRLLGADGGFGAMLGLSNDWMFNAIKQVGNYGESYERTVGKGSPLGLERGQNQLWTRGGILFTSPFQ